MIVMERVKTDSSIRQVPRQADALELSIVRPFDDLVIGQCIKYQRRNILSASKINRNNRRTVCAVSEKKNIKVRTFRVLIYTTLLQADGGICLNINFNAFHNASYIIRR